MAISPRPNRSSWIQHPTTTTRTIQSTKSQQDRSWEQPNRMPTFAAPDFEQTQMKLFEYEAKSFAQNIGIPVPRGSVASTPDEAKDIHKRLGGEVVVKAQVLVAGRGKAGGIKFGKTPDETRDRASEILSMTIKGEKVKKVLIEQKATAKKELFASIVLDRANRCQTVLASDQGGIDIEDVARQTPEKVLRHRLDPVFGMRNYDARLIGLKLGYQGAPHGTFSDVLSKL